MTILITDVDTRKGFDVYNIVKHFFSAQQLLIAASFRPGVIFSGAFSHKVHRIRTNDQQVFDEDLSACIEHTTFPPPYCYIPVEEKTTSLFYKFKKKNPNTQVIALLPSEEIFDLARDKYSLASFCKVNGIPHPAVMDNSVYSWTEREFRPLVCKPRSGSGSKGVQFIRDLHTLKNTQLQEGFFFQELVGRPKEVVGAFFLIHEGKCTACYTHQRIRTFPASGGVTVYSSLVENNLALKAGEELLLKLGWEGLAMVEFLWDEHDSCYKVIEINPRLWGSILLSEFSGANLLQHYIHLLWGTTPAKYSQKKNVYIRWLFPYDFILLLKSKGRIKDFWKFRKGDTCYINFTYSSWRRSICFILSVYLKWKKILSFKKKNG